MRAAIKLKDTHPLMYRSFLVFAVISIGLGLNFLFTRPTFNPYGFDKAITGSVFLSLGLAKLAVIFVFRNMILVRITMVLCMMFMLFWGVGSSFTYFTGQTSLQLFVLYMGLTALQLFLLLEPFINPLTASADKVADEPDVH